MSRSSLRRRAFPLLPKISAGFLIACLSTSLFAESWPPAGGVPVTRWGTAITADQPIHPEYPRPQMTRTNWLNLNGSWEFAITARGSSAPEVYGEKILVPFPVQSVLSKVNKMIDEQSTVWYRRSFELPLTWTGKRILLHFEASNWETKVWVNGKEVGSHKGGYDGFTFDITDALQPGKKQEIVASVWNPIDLGQPCGKQTQKPAGIFYTPATGIWQTVWVEPVADSYIQRLQIVPDVDRSEIRLTVGASKSTGAVKAVVLENGKEVAQATGVPGKELAIPIPAAKLWWPTAPFLYDLKVTLLEGKEPADTVGSYFGLRKISVGADERGVTRLLLNNKFIFQNGYLDQGYWPDGVYTAPSDEALRSDIEMTRALGFNMLRKHIKVEPQRWYYWADKLGVLVWQDMPSTRKLLIEDKNGRLIPDRKQQFEEELKRMVEGRFNHPSIVMWVIFNEGWGLTADKVVNEEGKTVERPSEAANEIQKRMVEVTRKLDPTRLINAESGTGGGKGANPEGFWDIGLGDVIDYHCYGGKDAPLAPEPNRASVVGEYGYGVSPISCKRFIDRSNELGLSALVLTQLTDVENETNGTLTYDRQLKPKISAQGSAAGIAEALRSNGLSSGPEAASNGTP